MEVIDGLLDVVSLECLLLELMDLLLHECKSGHFLLNFGLTVNFGLLVLRDLPLRAPPDRTLLHEVR